MKFYCINLDRRTDRRAQCSEEAEKAGIQLEFIQAVDGQELEYDQVREYHRNFRLRFYDDLKKGEVACCLSHCTAYRAFLNTEDEFAVILEDDFVLPENFKQQIEELVSNSSGWEAIRLQRSKKQEGPIVGKIGNHDIVFPLRVGLTTTACLYSRIGAKKSLKVYEHFFLPADEAMKFSHFYGLLMYEVNPIMIKQRRNDQSDIGGRLQRPPKHKGLLARIFISLHYTFGQGVRVLLVPIAKSRFKQSI